MLIFYEETRAQENLDTFPKITSCKRQNGQSNQVYLIPKPELRPFHHAPPLSDYMMEK